MRTYNLNVSNCFWGEVAEEPELQPELQPEASEPIAVETVEVKGEGTLKVRIPVSLNYYKMCIQMVMSSHVFVVGMTVNLETGWGWRDQRPKRKRGHSFSNSIFNSASVWFLKTCIYIYFKFFEPSFPYVDPILLPASSSSEVQETALALQEATVPSPEILEAVAPVNTGESQISPGQR